MLLRNSKASSNFSHRGSIKLETPPVSTETLDQTLIAEADKCVACGLCLPHCPTYRLTLSEADSPRGRIAMISGVMKQHIPMNERFTLHIDRCLTCRACEYVCPSKVSYGKLVDQARVKILNASVKKTDVPYKIRSWLERQWIDKPWRFDTLRPFVKLFQQLGLQRLLLRLPFLNGTSFRLLLSKLPPIRYPFQHWQSFYPAVGKQRGEVGLFLGCIARLIDVETHLSTIAVLNQLGYSVHVPQQQTCCGALYQHRGESAHSGNLLAQNQQTFKDLNLTALITTASGCGAHLVENNGFSIPVMDINQFLAEQDFSQIKFNPLAKRVAVHHPCTLRHILRGSQFPSKILAYIPEIELKELANQDQFCGAAGTYFLDQPGIAEALLTHKIQDVLAINADYLATSNIGCAFHIASQLNEQQAGIEVLHPVTLLARQMSIQ